MFSRKSKVYTMGNQTAKTTAISYLAWLKASLLLAAILLGVTAIWLPAGRHLRMEEKVEEVRREQIRMEQMIHRMRFVGWFVFLNFVQYLVVVIGQNLLKRLWKTQI